MSDSNKYCVLKDTETGKRTRFFSDYNRAYEIARSSGYSVITKQQYMTKYGHVDPKQQ